MEILPKRRKERMEMVCQDGNGRKKNCKEALVSCLYDHKIQMNFGGKGMELDLIQMYEDIRKMMARKFSGEDSGPETITVISSEISERERALLQNDIFLEKKEIKVCHNRIKYRVKLLRQNSKKAVEDGKRFGSGRLII